MARTTRTALDTMVGLINKQQGLPPSAYRFERFEDGGEAKGRWVPVPGHIGIDSDSPGDGWTRYRVIRSMEHGGEEHISPAMTAGECWHYLRGVMDVLGGRFGRPAMSEDDRELVLQAIDRWTQDIQDFDNDPAGDEAKERTAMLKDVRGRILGEVSS